MITVNGQPVPRAKLPHAEGMSEVGILDELMPAFEQWLHSRGLFLTVLPRDPDDEGNTFYAVGISDQRWVP